MPIRPVSVSALLKAVKIAKNNPRAEFVVPGDWPMLSVDVLAMWRQGVQARCNRGLRIAPDCFDLIHDARCINDYARGIRHSGCRGLLRTARMRARYPHINNQEASC